MVDSCQCMAKPIQYCKANPSLNYGIWLSHRENILKSLSSSDIQAAKDFTVVAKSCIIPTVLKSHQCFLSSGAIRKGDQWPLCPTPLPPTPPGLSSTWAEPGWLGPSLVCSAPGPKIESDLHEGQEGNTKETDLLNPKGMPQAMV